MATDTAVATADAPGTITGAAPIDPTRNLWQLPALLLGVAAFVCAWQGFVPLGPLPPGHSLEADIASLEREYTKVSPEPTALKNLLNKIATNVDAYPSLAPQARFHLGSGYVRLAEITPSPDEAQGYWVLAHQHFELVNEKQLRDPADRPKLIFRAAKARAVVGLPPDAPAEILVPLIAILSQPQPGEEAGETNRIVAELALRLNPPNVEQAKIALTRYVEATGISTPAASLARGRLRLADLYFNLKQYEQAQRWLKEIGEDAPVDVRALAKEELALTLMAAGAWEDAERELGILRDLPGASAFRVRATYQLGVCKLKRQRPDPDAAAQLFEAAAKGAGDESTAAALQLADLYSRSADAGRHKAAVDLLTRAVKDVGGPAAYQSRFVPLSEAQATFELAATALLGDGAYEEALKVVEVYSAIAAAGRDRQKRAEVLGAWGSALQKQKDPAAKSKFQAAADEFAALAEFQPKTDGKLAMLQQSASYSRQAEDPHAAVERLQKAVKLPGIKEELLPALWGELADALLVTDKPKEALKYFNKVMSEVHPISTATRYRLARVFADSRHAGFAPLGRALFEQIARQQNISPAEQEFHERSLTELANALIREGNFIEAEQWLRTQLELYRYRPEAPLARLLLGVCLLQRAAKSEAGEADAAKMRAEALVNFQQIVSDCDVIERRNKKLTTREAWLRLQAGLRVLQTYQQMKTREGAELLLPAAGSLLERHKGTVDELIILSLMYHAYKQLKQPGEALRIRDRMRELFERLPPTAFQHETGEEYSREYWQKIWFPPEKK